MEAPRDEVRLFRKLFYANDEEPRMGILRKCTSSSESTSFLRHRSAKTQKCASCKSLVHKPWWTRTTVVPRRATPSKLSNEQDRRDTVVSSGWRLAMTQIKQQMSKQNSPIMRPSWYLPWRWTGLRPTFCLNQAVNSSTNARKVIYHTNITDLPSFHSLQFD